MGLKAFEGIKKEYLILAGLLIAIILILYVMLFIIPATSKMRDLISREQTLQSQLATAKNVAKNKEQVTDEIKDIMEKIQYYEKLLPKNVDVSLILDDLIRMGKENGVVFSSVEPQEIQKITIPNQTRKYIEIPIKLLMRCGYHQAGAFINAVETSERFMEVNDLSIVNNAANVQQHDVRLTVTAFALEGN